MWRRQWWLLFLVQIEDGNEYTILSYHVQISERESHTLSSKLRKWLPLPWTNRQGGWQVGNHGYLEYNWVGEWQPWLLLQIIQIDMAASLSLDWHTTSIFVQIEWLSWFSYHFQERRLWNKILFKIRKGIANKE